jgi:prevent-host-death family protein
MNTATITQAKNGFSALIDRVKGGESVLILDRGVPVARLEPVSAYADSSGRLSRLERAGVLKIGTGPLPLDLLRSPAPTLAPGTSTVQLLVRERRAGW